ncbi:MAG: hypothetical protein L0Y56_05435 [Nitrospira sp.]|nr:hypothetical protein [Nitrospira sp.]
MERPCHSEIIFESSEGEVRSCVCGIYHLRWQNVSIRMAEDEFIQLARLLKIALGRMTARSISTSKQSHTTPNSYD